MLPYRLFLNLSKISTIAMKCHLILKMDNLPTYIFLEYSNFLPSNYLQSGYPRYVSICESPRRIGKNNHTYIHPHMHTCVKNVRMYQIENLRLCIFLWSKDLLIYQRYLWSLAHILWNSLPNKANFITLWRTHIQTFHYRTDSKKLVYTRLQMKLSTSNSWSCLRIADQQKISLARIERK